MSGNFSKSHIFPCPQGLTFQTQAAPPRGRLRLWPSENSTGSSLKIEACHAPRKERVKQISDLILRRRASAVSKDGRRLGTCGRPSRRARGRSSGRGLRFLQSRESGASNTPDVRGLLPCVNRRARGYWVARSSRAMTMGGREVWVDKFRGTIAVSGQIEPF